MKRLTPSNTNYYGYGGYYRLYYWGSGYVGPTTYNEDSYTDGSLVIDMLDDASKNLIWRGTGNREFMVHRKNR